MRFDQGHEHRALDEALACVRTGFLLTLNIVFADEAGNSGTRIG